MALLCMEILQIRGDRCPCEAVTLPTVFQGFLANHRLLQQPSLTAPAHIELFSLTPGGLPLTHHSSHFHPICFYLTHMRGQALRRGEDKAPQAEVERET